MTIELNSVVKLTRALSKEILATQYSNYVRGNDLPEQGLPAGSEGTIVDILEKPTLGYTVEFVRNDGKVTSVITVPPDLIMECT